MSHLAVWGINGSRVCQVTNVHRAAIFPPREAQPAQRHANHGLLSLCQQRIWRPFSPLSRLEGLLRVFWERLRFGWDILTLSQGAVFSLAVFLPVGVPHPGAGRLKPGALCRGRGRGGCPDGDAGWCPSAVLVSVCTFASRWSRGLLRNTREALWRVVGSCSQPKKNLIDLVVMVNITPPGTDGSR